jgi:nucleoside-diphosphate-sugar epimerase
MRIFLTGATGSIGSGVLQVLVDHGHEVTCPVRSLSKISDAGANPLIHYVEINDSQDDYTKFLHLSQGFSSIIHTGFVGSAEDAEKESNVLRGLLDSAKATAANEKVSLVFTTGCLLYGPMEKVTPDDEAGSENAVSFLKFRLAHEEQALAAAGGNLNVSVIRPVFVYGGSHVDAWFSACKKNGKIVVPQGNGRLLLIHKLDLGNFYRLLVENYANGIFAAGEDSGTDLNDLVELAKRLTGVQEVERVENIWPLIGSYSFTLFGLSLYQAVEPKRGRVELGFVPRYNILRDGESLVKLD